MFLEAHQSARGEQTDDDKLRYLLLIMCLILIFFSAPYMVVVHPTDYCDDVTFFPRNISDLVIQSPFLSFNLSTIWRTAWKMVPPRWLGLHLVAAFLVNETSIR